MQTTIWSNGKPKFRPLWADLARAHSDGSAEPSNRFGGC
jgi:hypothetical protein